MAAGTDDDSDFNVINYRAFIYKMQRIFPKNIWQEVWGSLPCIYFEKPLVFLLGNITHAQSPLLPPSPKQLIMYYKLYQCMSLSSSSFK